jgi:hypothetical protein
VEIKVSECLLWPISRPCYFRHRRKKYRLDSAGIRTLDVLRDIATSPACQSASGLLKIRPRIRGLLAYPAPVTLCYLIDRASFERTIRVAIWLLGRIGHPYATPSVARHVDHEDFRVRREVIRTLHRLHAWKQLRGIAANHPDPATRALAEPAEPRPYTDRLSRFVAHQEVVQSLGADRQLVIAPDVEVGAGRPPKSRFQIGLVLRRIRRLVRRRKRGRRWFRTPRRKRPLTGVHR